MAQLVSEKLGQGRVIEVLHSNGGGTSELHFVATGFGAGELVLHFGVSDAHGNGWNMPPPAVLSACTPSATSVPGAGQASFPPEGRGYPRRAVVMNLAALGGATPKSIPFVIHKPPNDWLKRGHENFLVKVPRDNGSFDVAASRVQAELAGTVRRWSVLDFTLVAVIAARGAEVVVHFLASTDQQVMLHYGTIDEHDGWKFARSQDFSRNRGVNEVRLSLPPHDVTKQMKFVLKLGGNHWVKDGRHDYMLELPESPEAAAARAAAQAAQHRAQEEAKRRKEEQAGRFQDLLRNFQRQRRDRQKAASVRFASFSISENAGELDLVAKKDAQGAVVVEILTCLNPTVTNNDVKMHWGAVGQGKRKEWKCPPEDVLPPQSKVMDAKACQSQLEPTDGTSPALTFRVAQEAIKGFCFVLCCAGGGRWLKNSDGRDCLVMLVDDAGVQGWSGKWPDVVSKIIESETEWGHMTLMHRYNLCAELVGRWESSPTSNNTVEMTRMPSWSALFRNQGMRASSFSRLPSVSLLPGFDEDDEEAEAENREFWSWIFVWQRFSYMRLLDWQRNYNTKPRELAGATDNLARKLSSVWKAHPAIRLWVRFTLSTLGRGGNKGQEIRDEILHIMHRNKIPETAGHFYEQWHQKLHNNTTPDDIGICKALLAFLKSGGNMGEYWRVLKDHGISKERLASYERRITCEPYMHGDTGKLIYEFENYLRILQSVHDALDLQTAIEAAKWCLPGDVIHKLHDVAQNSSVSIAPGLGAKSRSMSDLRNADVRGLDRSHQRFMKAAEVRMNLLGILNDKRTEPDAIRQLLLLDYSLETTQNVLIQGMTGEDRLSHLCEQMQALLTSVLGHMPLHAELRATLLDWMRLSQECADLRYAGSPRESALLLKAMVDRLSRVVGEQVDMFQSLIGPKSAHLGGAVGTEKQVLDVFVDEVLRGSALFSVSVVLKRMEPILRGLANLPPWQLISTTDHPVQGELQLIERMLHIQEKVYEVPTILLSGFVSGEEEVPVGVQAVLVRSAAEAPDILSHCAVRARNAGVLLATCFDPSISEEIAKNLVGKWVEVTCKPDGSLTVLPAERPKQDANKLRKLSRSASRDLTQEALQTMPGKTKLANMNLTNDLGCSWCVSPSQMNSSMVGSKSLNLAKLRPKLPHDIGTPQAVAMPYGCMQKVLKSKENSSRILPQLEKVLLKLQPTISNEEAKGIFAEAQDLVKSLLMPKELGDELPKQMEAVGHQDGEKRLMRLYDKILAWEATKQVWASLFGLRPWVSLAKANRSFHDLNMAVLVQEIVPAKYAFVLHTKNPFTGDPDEVYGELVPGRGETLVGNYPGRALSFRARRGQEPVVSSFLSKSTWLRPQECLIFRSDSNGEDLEGFAGAGLFESICAKPDIQCMVKFHRLQVIFDVQYRQHLLRRLAQVGRDVEAAFDGVPQDVEGCVDQQDRIFIVQSRPQV